MTGILSCFENLTLPDDQQRAALAIEDFLAGNDPIFLLKGYAGTGKTTLLSCICRYVATLERGVLMMAPTGRAAKVMADKSKLQAATIHKSIYNFHELETIEVSDEEKEGWQTFQFVYTLRSDADIVSQVFIIDEGSMVSDAKVESEFFRFGSGQVLKDLLRYSKAGQANVRTQLIFVGDPAQLPPVGMAFSPALDAGYFASTYNLTARSAELEQVVRQGEQSGILALATQVRHCIKANRFNHFAITANETDVQNMAWNQFMPAYQLAHTRKIVICYKNKTAKDLSERIRAELFGSDAPALQKGDMIVVGMNNFQLGVMNGTFGMISAIKDDVIERKYTVIRETGPETGVFRWQKVEVMFRGDDNQPRLVETWLLENFLLSDESRLDSVESQALYVDFVIRYKDGKKMPVGFTKTPEFKEALRDDPFFNALMVKYGYAVTCHKAQGSEWPDVFVCFDYSNTPGFDPLEDEQNVGQLTNSSFYRWAYTAITRGSSRLLAIKPPRFSVFSKLVWIDVPLATSFLATQGVDTTTIVWTATEDNWLSTLNAAGRSEPIQVKLLEIRHRLQPLGIQIQSVLQKPYQEHLTLVRAGETVQLVLHVNGNDKFKSYLIQRGDKSLAEIVRSTLNQPLSISIERATQPATVDPAVEYAPTSGQPQLAILFEQIGRYTNSKGITITGIKPMAYRERYEFKRNNDEAVIDFVYDDQGFFKEARPMANQCRGAQLLDDLHQLIHFLKH